MSSFTTLDYIIFAAYLLGMMAFGVYIARRFKNKSAEEYFMAGKSLPWWIVGGSLIASNISAEQMIGMSGSGFALGLGIATYELMAAATLILVGKFLIPVFLENNITTMPQFLEQRFDGRVRTGLAIFWLLLFVFVNVTSLLYLGGLAIESILGLNLMVAIVGLAIYSATFSIFGGLKAVVWSDLIQVIVLLVGGTAATVAILSAVSGGEGIIAGLQTLIEKAPEKFDMIFEKGDTYTDVANGESKSSYADLPGIGVLIGGMWIANLYYWGFNQYIIQRALAAKSVQEAQDGIAFAALIKIFLPFIVVVPGIAAYVLGADLDKADQAFPWVVNNYIGTGLKAVVVAALVAAIGSSLSSILNSSSTIFTLDLYKRNFGKGASEKQLVRVGQIAAAVILVIGILMTPVLDQFDQIFQFIQKYTGYFSPGILAIFLFGLFWKKTTTPAALTAVIVSLPLSYFADYFFPEAPFLDKMGYNFLILSALIVVISLFTSTNKGLVLRAGIFKTSTAFKIMAVLVGVLLGLIYYKFW